MVMIQVAKRTEALASLSNKIELGLGVESVEVYLRLILPPF